MEKNMEQKICFTFYNSANATYLLSYDIGIGIGSFLMGMFQESIGLASGFAVTAVTYIIGGIIYAVYVDRYYSKLLKQKQ